MSIQFSLGKRLLRAAVSLGFLGCLVAAGTLSSQAALSESTVVSSEALTSAVVAVPSFGLSLCANPNNGSDLSLSAPVEMGPSDEFGVALEDDDPIEMLRVDIQQRTFGIDRIVIGQGVTSEAARSARPDISPPLLV
jgi:hypothetical protein